VTRPAEPRHAGPATAARAGRTHPAAGVRRLVRVLVLGGSSLALAATAHRVAGGALPSAWVLAVLSLLVGLVAVTATARRCRTPLLVAVLGVEQLVLHAVLAATAVPVGVAGCLAGPHARHGMAGGCPGAVPLPAGSASTGAPSADTLMWAAHAAAVLGTAWLLARGEAVMWRAVERVADAVPVLGPRVRSGRTAPRTPAPAVTALRRPGTAAAPRGPPLLA
jgi:hypothetical protein